MNNYPQHEKAVLVHDKSLLLSEFLDWLEGEKIQLAHWGDEDGLRLLDLIYESKEAVIARFLGIDLKAFHAEKDSMLKEYRRLAREHQP